MPSQTSIHITAEMLKNKPPICPSCEQPVIIHPVINITDDVMNYLAECCGVQHVFTPTLFVHSAVRL